MNSYELLVKGFLDAHHESQIRICEELGLITEKDLDSMANVENWLPLWKKVFRSVREKGLQSQLWERLRREGVVHHDPNPFEVADLVAEVSHGVSFSFISRAEMVGEKLKADAERVKDLAAAGQDNPVWTADDDLDACGDVNTKTVERIRDFTERLENGAAIGIPMSDKEKFTLTAEDMVDGHARSLEASVVAGKVASDILQDFEKAAHLGGSAGDLIDHRISQAERVVALVKQWDELVFPQELVTKEEAERSPTFQEWLQSVVMEIARAMNLPSYVVPESGSPSWSVAREGMKTEQGETQAGDAGEDLDSGFESPEKNYVPVEEIYADLISRYRHAKFAQDGKVFTFDVELDNDENQVRLVNYQSGNYCWMVVLYPMPAGKVNAVCVSGQDNIKKAYGMTAEHIEGEQLGERVIDVQAILDGEDWWTNGPEREINYATTWAFTTGKDQRTHWWLNGDGEKTACGMLLEMYLGASGLIFDKPGVNACPECREVWDRLTNAGERINEGE
ncbi:hypothetical protein [Gimesia chilikensis]|uniref:hypothetical protein n=1 Tax=Gimesia chilikensis TaxID=2605989 RepID=UPI003A8DF0B2